jgi:hypothetical protein
MRLANIRDWLKGFNIGDNFYIGKLDNKKEKSIGVYLRDRSDHPVTTIGGPPCGTYDITSVKLLIHWNTNSDESEQAARSLFAALRSQTQFTIDNTLIHYPELLCPEPIEVGTDDNGVYEWVIEFSIYYERN